MHPYLKPGIAALLITGVAAVLLQPLDLRCNYARHRSLIIPNRGEAVVVRVSPKDGEMLGAADYAADPTAWRPLHARLVDQLVQAGVRVIAFDVYFSKPAPEHSQELAAALERSLKAGVPVILGMWDERLDHALYDEQRAYPAVLRAVRDDWMDVLKRIAVFRDFGDGKAPVPSLFLQAYSLATTGQPARIEGRRVAWPAGLPMGEYLWIRYAARPPVQLNLRDVLNPKARPEKLEEEVKGKVVLVGVVGRWGARDVHPVPFVPPGQPLPDGGAENAAYGVYVQAHALNQLAAREFVRETVFWTSLLLLLLGALVGALPILVLGRRSGVAVDLFQTAAPSGATLARLRVWPWPPMIAVVLITAATAATWSLPVFYPVAGVMAASLVTAASLSVPGLVARMRVRRLVSVLVRVDELTRRKGRPALVRIPPGGTAVLMRALGVPILDEAAAKAMVETLYGVLVEAEAGKTFQQRISRAFFARHGWLETEAAAVQADAGAGKGRKDQSPASSRDLLERADQLAEAFCGSALRRIRNLWEHTELAPHAVKLGNDALLTWSGCQGRLGSGACARLQRSLLIGCADYLAKLAGWIESDAGADG